MIVIREYRTDDAGALMKLLHETVHAVCAADYTPEQLEAWSPTSGLELGLWRARFDSKQPFVAVRALEPVGFIELEADGHIDCLYVQRDFQRRGVGTLLLRQATLRARALSLPRLHLEASITAVPFFASQQFSIIRAQEVERRGQRLQNFLMERHLETS